MFRTMMKAKIHRARVTEANLNYVGSVTIDESILEQVGLLPNEKVQIVNNNNGERLENIRNTRAPRKRCYLFERCRGKISPKR